MNEPLSLGKYAVGQSISQLQGCRKFSFVDNLLARKRAAGETLYDCPEKFDFAGDNWKTVLGVVGGRIQQLTYSWGAKEQIVMEDMVLRVMTDFEKRFGSNGLSDPSGKVIWRFPWGTATVTVNSAKVGGIAIHAILIDVASVELP